MPALRRAKAERQADLAFLASTALLLMLAMLVATFRCGLAHKASQEALGAQRRIERRGAFSGSNESTPAAISARSTLLRCFSIHFPS